MTTSTPEPTPTTARVWESLPEAYRLADAEQTPPFPLRRYLQLVLDRADVARELLERINYRSPDEGGPVGATSDLTDPRTADPRWLPWLAQLVGVPPIGSLTTQQARDQIAAAASGWRSGTMPGLIAATRSFLTASGYGRPLVRIDRDPARPWHLIVRTAPLETPQGAAELLRQVAASGAKAAGVVLTWVPHVASWDVIEAVFPTWDRIEAANPWDHLEAAHPVE